MKLYYIFGIILVLASCGCLEKTEVDKYVVDDTLDRNLTISIQKDNITDIRETKDTLYIYTDINYTRSY